MPQGWTQVADTPASGWTPVAERTNLDRLLEWLPSIGGAAGGAIGGAGGTVAGVGVGGVPGAMGGAALGSMAGKGLLDALNFLRGKPAPTSVGQSVQELGTEGALQAVTELAGAGATKLLSAGGRAVYRGYLKPSLSAALLDEAPQIVETGVREAIPVTAGGAARAQRLIGELGTEVDRLLKQAGSSGDVDLHQVAEQVRAFAKREYYRPGQPLADFEAAMRVADELDAHPSMALPNGQIGPRPKPTATLDEANQIKRGLYRSIGETNFGVDRGATKTAQKVAASGIRQGIEDVAPGVGPINARQGHLIALAQAVDRATGREANRNQLFGVPSLVAGGAGVTEALRGNRFFAGGMAAAVRAGLSPAIATRAAIYAAKLGDAMPGTAVADITRLAIGLASEAGRQGEQ